MKFLIVLGVMAVLLVVGAVVFFWYVGTYGPATRVAPGRQVARQHVETLREIGLLEEGETLQWFYSDALLDIKGGAYIATDRKLAAYNSQWAEPAVVAPYDRITDLSMTDGEGMFFDSVLEVTLDDGTAITIPLATEGGGDRSFYEFAQRKQKDAEARD